MKIRKATVLDLKNIKQIYLIAKQHMDNEKNYTQWTDYGIFEEDVVEYIKNNNYYVVEEENEIIGMFAMIYGIDIIYNVIKKGNWLNNSEYITIHRIAVKYFQKQIASFILDYVIDRAKKNNIYNIRIDTHKNNVSMKKFLLKKNFQYCGEISILQDFNNDLSIREAYQKIID